MQVSTLRPGLMVSLSTSMKGNVSYTRNDIVAAHIAEDGTEQAKWETDRRVDDPAEYERGSKARSKARSLISAVCTPSNFGLLCPEDDKEKLDLAITEAMKVAQDFNMEATLTRVNVYVMIGRVAADDVEAIRAINSEMRSLFEDMEAGINKLDVEAVRAAANKAVAMGQMLSPMTSLKVEEAVKRVRSLARRMVKAGETAAVEIDAETMRRLAQARMSFLDLDDQAEILAPEAEGIEVDFAPIEIAIPATAVASPELEV